MRTRLSIIITTFLLCFASLTALGQEKESDISADSVFDLLRYQKNELLDSYNCRKTKTNKVQTVQPKVLNNNLYGIYQAIIPNAQNLSNNASAFTYAYNEDKQTLGISAAFPFPSKRLFFNTGIYTETSNGLFNLYSSGSWNNNVAFNLGFSGILSASQYLKNPKKCEKCNPKRKVYADSLMLSYAKALAIDTMELIKKKESIQHKIDSLINLKEVRNVAADTTNYTKQLKEIIAKLEYYEELKQAIKKENGTTYLSDRFAEFDEEQDLLEGYNILWWNANGSISNTTINIADTLYSDGTRVKNHPTIQLMASLMGNHLGRRTLQYLSLSGTVKRGNFLNDPTFRGAKPSIVYQNDVPYISMNNSTIGAFDDITKPVWQYTISLYYANFFLFDKSLGLSFRAEHNNAFKNNTFPNYQENYTLTIGPIFRAVKEEAFSKSTFGILAGFINSPYKVKAKDFFSVQAYLGIPFNALIAKK